MIKIDRYVVPFHWTALKSLRNLWRNETVNTDNLGRSWTIIVDLNRGVHLVEVIIITALP